MACDCMKTSDNVLAMAETEAKTDGVDYVIYVLNSKRYYDKKDCWIKNGKQGTLERIIFV